MPALESEEEDGAPAASSTKRVCPDQPALTRPRAKRPRRQAETAGVIMPPEDEPYVLVTQRESRTVKPSEKARAMCVTYSQFLQKVGLHAS